jgi:2'-5' RNA ligase
VKWVERENLHATLLFLGEVDDRGLPQVCEVVTEGARQHAGFVLSVETVGCFPSPRRPRVLWVGVGQGAEALCAIHETLENPLAEMGFRREERRYTPHITLGRVKSDRPTEKLAGVLAQQAAWKGGETAVHELVVMSSQLSPQGPVYGVMSRAKLG